MAGLDLSMLFDPDCDPNNLPSAAGSLFDQLYQQFTFGNEDSAETSNEIANDSTTLQVSNPEVHNSNDENMDKNPSIEQSGELTSQVDYGSVFSPGGKQGPPAQTNTSTPLRELCGEYDQLPNFSGSSTQNAFATPTPSTSYEYTQISHVSATPMNSTTKRGNHPRGWSMPKKRLLNDFSSMPAIQPPPNYRSIIQRSQVPFQRNNYGRQMQAMSFVMGTSNNLPDPDFPDNDEAEPPSEEEKEMVNELRHMIENGDVSSWEKIVDQISGVRKRYAHKDYAAYFHDRNRVLTRLKPLYDSLNVRPTQNDFEPTPERMTKELKPHQKSGLKFMLWRETQDPCGGILADDMGLGKTMSIVALVSATLNVIPSKMKRPVGIQYTGPTLIVCPASLTQQWSDEFNSSSKGIRVLVHHGEAKAKKVEEFMSYHVVITSYGMVMNELRCGKNLLYKVYWKRIVLDEGHLIRNFQAMQSEATCGLHGKLKWILTGTPIHNRVDDIYPYLIFLRCDPFDERTIFLKWAKDRQGQARVNVILKALMIRRTKEELKTLKADKIVESFEYELEPKENECYKRLMALSKTMMKVFLNDKARRNYEEVIYRDQDVYNVQKIMRKRMNGLISYNHILVLLLRLRQLCSHPTLISPMLSGQSTTETQDNDDEEDVFREEDANVMGQIINDAIDDKDIFNVKNEIFDPDHPSSKISMLLYVMQERFIKTKDKALIVCEWPSYLKIIADHLSMLSLSYEFYTGETDMKERPEIVKRFNSDVMNPRVLLLSLTCGGIGLNLAKANHIFLVCTHWNPQIELQAEDRCYRIGQERDVHIYKFRAQGTIEERIYNLQQHKLKLADKMLTGATGNNYRLTINDLKTLFGL